MLPFHMVSCAVIKLSFVNKVKLGKCWLQMVLHQVSASTLNPQSFLNASPHVGSRISLVNRGVNVKFKSKAGAKRLKKKCLSCLWGCHQVAVFNSYFNNLVSYISNK